MKEFNGQFVPETPAEEALLLMINYRVQLYALGYSAQDIAEAMLSNAACAAEAAYGPARASFEVFTHAQLLAQKAAPVEPEGARH